ncbi:hypothetical protein VIGAN_09000100 [Vigna angularis var. angularis]|uniref:Uncharacterized protein n=1 Tax=Vigna angularis var. angularis TaxID=157739 RepID=A0A0S3SVC1_PHAAN|nr:hypothetical protein VIGAN_09000100 [Vigna angularis var. angularis]
MMQHVYQVQHLFYMLRLKRSGRHSRKLLLATFDKLNSTWKRQRLHSSPESYKALEEACNITRFNTYSSLCGKRNKTKCARESWKQKGVEVLSDVVTKRTQLLENGQHHALFLLKYLVQQSCMESPSVTALHNTHGCTSNGSLVYFILLALGITQMLKLVHQYTCFTRKSPRLTSFTCHGLHRLPLNKIQHVKKEI